MRTPSALLLALALLSGCAGPSYYYQAVSGHLDLMRSRQDIGAYLATAPESDELAGRLVLARQMLEFAAAELDLPAGDSYQSYADTGREAVVWNVVATPEFSLRPKTWCFPVAGCVPYRGYFEQEKAQQAADRMRRKGMDVAVSGAVAYSSLGWFDDPILDSTLALTDSRLAGTLFHELAHQRIYVKGDTSFNEAYATFTERAGVEAWLHAQGRSEDARQWRQRLRALDAFQNLLLDARGQLEAVYASGLPPEQMRENKQSAFAELQARHEVLTEQAWNGRAWFSGWFEKPPNNADLALANSYLGGLCAFHALHAEAGGDFVRFQQLAGHKANLPDAERSAWLNRPCP